MRRKFYTRDWELSARMTLTMFLLGLVYLFFVAFLWRIGLGVSGVVFFAGTLLLIQYFFSDRIALWGMGAKEVSEAEAPELHAMVARLAAQAGLPRPRVAISPLPVPNAFATGRSPRHAVVAVTQGLLDTLTPPEVEAVLGHELTHVANRDVAVMTLAAFFATVAGILTRMAMWGGFYGGYGRRRDEEGSGWLVVLLVSYLVYIVSFLLIRALSRYRELMADRGGAILVGRPSLLASALLKISGVMQRVPTRDLRQLEAYNAFFIVPALRAESIANLFSTHPPVEVRVARLAELEREMGLAAGT